ncbi:uncharacterized protein PITG_13094 [Phytophthora infestans T30-4]|uniref:Ubiquitin-like domain-containing protein n=1 Tax=Phytophthora infestans (strain T30-4) TaxID=403677 RepID=D0NK99_PHYIT|nr:uncharacterized protein PITG_13094 [Phytophthora infestans T30-4]EEY59936.1 conserved hypothetical protein [Phytophthora infestans T30-4]KAI9981353.1 hypothetical protein PInf_009049 [Phytophthora infestans]|eukprot:XP_002900621.1 conserved hypothetical protein [Phytophthora infestans T30-4]
MADKAEVVVTVVFGKQSTSLSVPTQNPQALELLKTHIYENFQLAPEFQRLVLRGRDVKSGTTFTEGCKLLLLPPGIDVSELEDDALLVQLFRGKARYDLIFPRSGTILEVKKKVSAVLGLSSAQALRLVVKGKTPKDDTVLQTLSTNKKVIKAMALLQEQQHVVQEKEEDLRELLNELASAQAALQRVQRQMARNFTSRDESLFELSRLLDEGQRIADNLELIKHQLGEAKTSGPRASEQTLAAVVQAIHEANSLTEVAQILLEETHSSY